MRRLRTPPGREVQIEVDGEPITAHEGELLASAMLAAGERIFSRSVKYHRPRGPFCLSAACTHCLMRVDGAPNVYTCKTRVRAGMRVERQNAYPSAEHDVFASINWLFPHGMNHHEMFAGVPVAEKVMLKVARHLAGLGVLPDKAVGERMQCETLELDVAVAGGGAAGSAALEVLAAAGPRLVLFEREDFLGGKSVPPGQAPPPAPRGGQVRLRAAVIGLYDDERGRFLAVTQYGPEGPRLIKAYAKQFLIASGGHPCLLPFENNDLPGVFAGRAAALLLHRDGLLPGEEPALVGHGPELYALARQLEQAGAKVTAIVDLRDLPPAEFGKRAVRGGALKAHGRAKVSGLSFKPEAGRARKVDCDAIIVVTPLGPSFELARQGGAHVVFSEAHRAFVAEADAEGRTRAADLFLAGDVLGPMSPGEAAESGRRAARALLGGTR